MVRSLPRVGQGTREPQWAVRMTSREIGSARACDKMSGAVATSFFVSDMHGSTERYEKLFDAIARERPAGVFLGGDLLPHRMTALAAGAAGSFLDEELLPRLDALRGALGAAYPQIFVIFGNDDPRADEESALEAERRGLWR